MRPPQRAARSAAAGLVLAAALALGGCSTVGYLASSAGGHLALLQAARPVDDWLADPATPAALRERLVLSQRMRDFAVAELHLPDTASYRRYADLHRPAAVWNAVAAPELGLTLRTSCFPVVGCVGYRGYFDRAAADAQAAVWRSRRPESTRCAASAPARARRRRSTPRRSGADRHSAGNWRCRAGAARRRRNRACAARA